MINLFQNIISQKMSLQQKILSLYPEKSRLNRIFPYRSAIDRL
ncbi:hypothetical protein CSC35_2222 [Enterobacter hormaechei]|nr:hypothetical protein CSC35_2222 [Enterobacter hormaechei]